ncbi:MAG: phage portal protein [Gammaproteobacteria bacterium]|nr:phage portal protein [Gammaproteobacteria bacterium]
MVKRPVKVQENWIDKAYRYVAPIKAAERYKARMTLALAGSYNGASRTRRSLADYLPTGGDADTDLMFDLPLLRKRSRDLARNNPLSLGAINTVCTNVVGTGLKLQARIDRDFLGMSDEEADQWESNVEREFRLWAESADCDAGRTLNFAGIQELVFRSTLENGDCFVLMPFITRGNNPYSLCLQIIEADRVCNQNKMADSDTLVGGVRKDQYGAPIEYHILKGHPGNIYSVKNLEWLVVPAFGGLTGRRNVIHLYKMLRPGQTRGVPYLAPVIESLKQLGNYTDAEVMAAVISSYFTVFIKSPQGDTDLAPMQPISEVGGSQGDSDYKLASGAIVGLAEGEDISTANPGRPNAQFDPFVQAVLRQIGVALELPFEILIKHFTASYSAARAALLEAWRFFTAKREWLAQNFCQVAYEAWLTEAIATGRINAPGFIGGDPAIRNAYTGTEWTGPAPGQIDPLKEIQAAKERVDLGVSTLSRETAALTGEDWQKTHQQSVKEHKMREEAGLLLQNNPNNSFPSSADKTNSSGENP